MEQGSRYSDIGRPKWQSVVMSWSVLKATNDASRLMVCVVLERRGRGRVRKERLCNVIKS